VGVTFFKPKSHRPPSPESQVTSHRFVLFFPQVTSHKSPVTFLHSFSPAKEAPSPIAPATARNH
jgi:hypothetical protein